MTAANRLTIDSAVLERVNAAIQDTKAGKMVILVDDEDRENEGDLVIAAECVSAEAINFMAMHGRGLICLAMDEAQVDRLELPMMAVPGRDGPPLGTAFTVSIEAAEGVTTGISAADRAHTIQVAIGEGAGPRDLVTPGHVFPLRARPGGVLVRTGQTEGAVDLARLAGLKPSGVICEIMKDDGTMARMPDLEVFAKRHALRILTVADLITYRMQTERLVQRLREAEVKLGPSQSTWRVIVYRALVEERQALALVKGDVATGDPVLCRVHSGNTFADVFDPEGSLARRSLKAAMTAIENEGAGVVLYLAPTGTLDDDVSPLAVGESGAGIPMPRDSNTELGAVLGADLEKVEPGGSTQDILRRFGLGAQMLADLGVQRLRLLTNSRRRLAGLTGFGLEIEGRVPLELE